MRTIVILAAAMLASCSSVSEQDVTDTLQVSQARAQEFLGMAQAFDAIAGTVEDDTKRGILKARIASATGNYKRLADAMDTAIRKLGEVDYEALYQRLEGIGNTVWDKLSDQEDD